MSTTVSAGTTIYIDKSAPNGIYYGYICVPQKKVHFKVQNCSLNYTSWTTKYEKTFDYAPQKDLEYITVKRVTD